MKANGYEIYSNTSVVAIATGFKRKSENRKTGNMIQVWILPKHIHPVIAQKTGQDALVCGNCPLRPANAGAGEARCYVNLGQAPAAVWRTFRKGLYPKLENTDVFKDRAVRFGAYGDPTKIPLPLIAEISSKAKRWTGYTHQWRNPLLKGYSRYLMASVDDIGGQIEATAEDWRTFRVALAGSDWKLKDEISCPASKEAGQKTKCAKCGLCAGQGKQGAKNIVIQAH